MPVFRTRLRPAVAAAFALWTPLAAAQTVLPDPAASGSAAVDSTDPLVWARHVVAARQAAEARLAAQAVEIRAAAEATSAPARTVAVLSHLFVPAGAEALVERQAGVVRRQFGSVRGRARRTFPMIERALRRRGLPDDLKYVAVIESALDPDAVSPAGAAGLWQFMPGTAADYGLDALGVRDPARATDAAVRYLDRLGRAFDGDWQLALAAYNCGPARVRRLVDAHRARTGTPAPTFWDIHDALPAETRAYVPRFIAAAAHFGSHGA